MARICPLFSGSTGNCTYIASHGGAILVDAGGSYKAIVAALQNIGADIGDIKAIAVTHEHTDHIKGLKTLLKNTALPLIGSAETLESLAGCDKIPSDTKLIVADDTPIEVGSFILNRFSTSHDCNGSSGYTVTLPDGQRTAVCTDLGVMTDEVRNALYGCSTVLIESNHDIDMLKRGPYPAILKLRILSDNGHLSNNACAVELSRLLKGGTTRFILGHISRNNNLPTLALAAAKATLTEVGAVRDRDYILTAAKPDNNEVTVF